MFRTFNFVTCRFCGQKYNMILPDQQRADIEQNISRLLDKYDRVAIYGMNYPMIDLFSHSTLLKSDNIYPIDDAESVQKSDVIGKQIFSANIIAEKKISVVVVALSHHYSNIRERILSNYGAVRTLDICELLNSVVRI